MYGNVFMENYLQALDLVLLIITHERNLGVAYRLSFHVAVCSSLSTVSPTVFIGLLQDGKIMFSYLRNVHLFPYGFSNVAVVRKVPEKPL